MLYSEYGTIVGPGHWFERERIYMRIGFGYPSASELQGGLNALHQCIMRSVKS